MAGWLTGRLAGLRVGCQQSGQVAARGGLPAPGTAEAAGGDAAARAPTRGTGGGAGIRRTKLRFESTLVEKYEVVTVQCKFDSLSMMHGQLEATLQEVNNENARRFGAAA